MTAQPIRNEFQFTSQTAQRQEEIVNKLNELATGIGVGVNYYPGGADKLKVRFGDHRHSMSHVVLTPQEILTVRAYMDNQDQSRQSPAYNKARALFDEADGALVRAQDYIREQGAKLNLSVPRASVA